MCQAIQNTQGRTGVTIFWKNAAMLRKISRMASACRSTGESDLLCWLGIRLGSMSCSLCSFNVLHCTGWCAHA